MLNPNASEYVPTFAVSAAASNAPVPAAKPRAVPSPVVVQITAAEDADDAQQCGVGSLNRNNSTDLHFDDVMFEQMTPTSRQSSLASNLDPEEEGTTSLSEACPTIPECPAEESPFVASAPVNIGAGLGTRASTVDIVDVEQAQEELDRDGPVQSSSVTGGSSAQRVGPQDFEILRVVGQGAFGKVFQVRHKESGQIYAMKVMRKGKIVERNHGEYVMAERDVLTAIIHPYIVTLRFSFQTPSKLYLVLDFINGGHLFFNLYRQGVFLGGPGALVHG